MAGGATVSRKLAGAKWSDHEVAELQALVGVATISAIGERLGRPYAGVACKISELGMGPNFGNRSPIKLPRGAGYTKADAIRYSKAIDKSDMPVSRFARSNGLRIEYLCASLERHVPEWWQHYRAFRSDVPETECEYCGRRFVPSIGTQRFCTRKCGADQRTDNNYFGGNRRKAIGWTEGVCQICGRTPDKGLTPHHILGKENDPEDSALVAVCQGCHNLVTALGSREFTGTQWEALISLAWLRKHGPELVKETDGMTGMTCVEVCVAISQSEVAS